MTLIERRRTRQLSLTALLALNLLGGQMGQGGPVEKGGGDLERAIAKPELDPNRHC